MKTYFRVEQDGTISDIANPLHCSFGITEAGFAIFAAVSASMAAGATAVGVGAATAGILGDVGAGALAGGVLGAATDWKHPLKGAEYGAITGASLGAGPALGAGLGIGTIAGDTLAGAAGGALGGAATGRDVGTSALMGGASGLTAGLLTPGALTGTPAAAAAGPAGSAASTAAPASVAGAAGSGGDLTSAVGSTLPSSGLSSNVPGQLGVGAATGAQTSFQSPFTTSTGLSAPSQIAAPPTSINAPSLPNVGGAAAPAAAPGGFDMLKSPQGLMAIGGLGMDLLKGNQTPPGFDQLKSQASQFSRQGAQLQSYLQSGTLPVGLQHTLDTAASAAKASVKQQYANSGMSGSSAEAQDLQGVTDRETAEGAQIATNLLQQGVQESQMGAAIYTELMQIQMEQDQQLSSGIGNFVSAFASMSKPTQAPAGG